MTKNPLTRKRINRTTMADIMIVVFQQIYKEIVTGEKEVLLQQYIQ